MLCGFDIVFFNLTKTSRKSVWLNSSKKQNHSQVIDNQWALRPLPPDFDIKQPTTFTGNLLSLKSTFTSTRLWCQYLYTYNKEFLLIQGEWSWIVIIGLCHSTCMYLTTTRIYTNVPFYTRMPRGTKHVYFTGIINPWHI